MPKIEGGLNISVSAGRGPRASEQIPAEEVRQIIYDAQIANQKARAELGLDKARGAINHLELNKPTNI